MTWFTARELAGLPGLPGTEFRTREALGRLGVPSRPRTGRVGGGGREYDGTSKQLPASTRRALIYRQMQARAQAAPEALSDPSCITSTERPPQPVPATSASRQPPSDGDKACADARLLLVNRMLELSGSVGLKRATASLADLVTRATAAPELLAAARTASQRSRDGAISPRTLERWLAAHRAQGWWGLLPAPVMRQPAAELDEDVA
ncbi:DNA-binding protein, partial [Leptospira sp. SA-E8]|uniref:DNA-binding protein n=1 Tax=Leptospira sp. SA-E8 TaxID=3422259 RepID=UPI003EBBF0A3